MQVGRHLRQDEGCKDAAIEGLMKAEEQVGGDRKLGDVDGAHSNPLGSVHAKGHWQRLKTHLPADQQVYICSAAPCRATSVMSIIPFVTQSAV